MRACRDPVFGMVVCGALMVLLGVLGVSHALAQTTQTSAVELTFPDLASTLQLRGSLYRPDGPGPFPAVVALHGCGGIRPRLHQWAATLHQWGYVVLLHRCGMTQAHQIYIVPTVIFLLLLRVFRTLDGPFSPIMKKRAEGAAASVGDVVSFAAKSSAVRAGSSSWSATA
jgi:hypothetical protein